MAHDIFVSYGHEDDAWARRLVAALRAQGWSVVWDHDIAPGAEWRKSIDSAIDAAQVVIVIWSPRSYEKPFVIAEAARALARETMLPVFMERMEPPKVFEHIQAADLSTWCADDCPPELVTMIDAWLAGQRAEAAESEAERRHRELMAQQARTLELLARDRGVPFAALAGQLARLGEVDVAADQMPARIETFVDAFLKLQADFARATNADPEIAATHRKALDLLNAGDLDEARKLFDDALVRMRERHQQTSRETATLLADRARIDVLQVRYADAVAAYEEAADLVRFDAEATLGYLEPLIDTLISQGNEFGDNAALLRAVEVIRTRALPLVSRERAALEWARMQHWLGVALDELGGRESTTAHLEEAVAVYRAALEERTRERVPLEWAATQNNLGNTLLMLGARETGTTRLEEAVAALRAALQESPRERTPLHWAQTQSNLGIALSNLGERESGTARLEEAVAAYRAALQEYARGRVPLDWARTQNNLGGALLRLGRRESGTARLEEAVVAYRAALQERTRERVPLKWADSQHNLGAVLSSLGDRLGDTARLEEAVAAFRVALEAYAPAHLSRDRQLTQEALDRALSRLAKHRQGGR